MNLRKIRIGISLSVLLLAIGISITTRNDITKDLLNNKQSDLAKNAPMSDTAHGLQTSPNDSTGKNTDKYPIISPDLKMVLTQTFSGYFGIQEALTQDDLSTARKMATTLLSTLNNDQEGTKTTAPNTLWATTKPLIASTLTALNAANDLDAARAPFEALSKEIENLLTYYGGGQPVYKYFCPMVDGNRGASWLQKTASIKNPYYGSKMSHCGSKVENL